MNRYQDIMDLPHPTFRKHPRMPTEKRAVQFAPFAALTGYDEAINEATRNAYANIDSDDYTIERRAAAIPLALDGGLK